MPYKKVCNIDKVNGITLVEGKSGYRCKTLINNKLIPIYWGEENFYKHYFDSNNRIYTDKLAKLVLKINNDSINSLVIDRLSKIFKYIFIDEVQDMVGYDLDFIRELLKSKIIVKMVGDPRQNVYDTCYSLKNKKYNDGKIEDFIKNECKSIDCDVDNESLNICYRCHEDITAFANKFYGTMKPLDSVKIKVKEHQGVFFVSKDVLDVYINTYSPCQLRFNKSANTNINCEAINYKLSKGMTLRRAIIYPTKEFENYLYGKNYKFSSETKNAIYVAITRPVDSLAILCDFNKLSEENKKMGKEWNNK